MFHRLLPFVAVLLLSAALPAGAARPLQTEDAGILDPGSWELELSHVRLGSGADRARETAAQIGRGIGLRSQIALALGRATADGLRTTGVTLLGKTELWNDGRSEAPAGLALAWVAGWNRDAGDRLRHTAREINLVYTRPLGGALAAHVNLGHSRDPIGRRSSTGWAVALEHEGIAVGEDNLAPMAEVFGDDRGSRRWSVGLRWTLKPDAVWADVSHGRSLRSPGAPLTSVGLKLAH